ncbi:hypothetical protein ScPMuIL_009793 [Solemya velum]
MFVLLTTVEEKMEPLMLVRIAAVVLGIGTLFVVIGLATDYWWSFFNANLGLWRVCSGVCGSFPVVTGTLSATRAFAVLSFLAGVAATVVAVLWAVGISITEKKMLRLMAVAAGFASAGLGLLAVIIFAADVGGNFGWSFALMIVGSIANGIGGGLLIVPLRGVAAV